MRRVNLRRMASFITHEDTLDINTIRTVFIAEHEKYLQLYPAWNHKATRRSVIASYWFREALKHFSLIMGVALIFTIPQCSSWLTLFASVLFAGIPALFSLTVFIYFPSFFWSFLPKLEAITGEQEKLAAHAQEATKCKRSQFQAPTLIIIYYVNCKISSTPLLPANDSSAELLNKLYGSNKDKLKQNLSRLYKIPSLSAKERAEMLKGVENARDFFKDSGNINISKILHELELKLNR
ncbi:hypothetical protein A3860_39275 [Niastella vici]|uniref:Uncharacterized protein n=1 Tax=Niastella vici TaxID=1703345 RepID=A0A1V9FKE0_9BACT|nr:hypothetical protein [Niastella vici]OQP58853.1 hypothetical protein A3860_39275 [Niastella vici]